jgi:hypothetical protein
MVGLLLGFCQAGLACDETGQDCQRGTEGCFCTEDYACLTGLVCLSEHCVDPDWTPEADSGVAGSGDSADSADSSDGGDSADGDGSGDGDTAPDNVGACEGWIESAECGDYDWSQSVDCSAYANLACDISDYFNCLNENTGCNDGIPDTSGWTECYALASCS